MGIKSKIAFKQKQISLADFLINNKTKPKGESKALTKTQKWKRKETNSNNIWM